MDANLSFIREKIQRELYDRLGLPARNLACIDSYSRKTVSGSVEEGYMFTYLDRDKAFGNMVLVELDKNGSILKVVKTK